MDNETPKTILQEIKERTLDLCEHDVASKLLTYDEEVAAVQDYLRRYSHTDLPTKADQCQAEIEFYVANNMVRHLCAVAADFYDRTGNVEWEPVGFNFDDYGNQEVIIEFREWDDEKNDFFYYEGVLSRHGSRYKLSVSAGLTRKPFWCNSIFDVVNVLAVPRAYLEGLFDMSKYGMARPNSDYAAVREKTIAAIGTLRQIEFQIKDRSQRLQELKRPKKWQRKIQRRNPKIPSCATDMPLPPTKLLGVTAAQIEYRDCAGIYFFWDVSGKCAYVGKSQNIGQRLSSHDKLKSEYAVTAIPFDVSEIHFAELYYIWLMRPYANNEGIKTASACEKRKNLARVADSVDCEDAAQSARNTEADV